MKYLSIFCLLLLLAVSPPAAGQNNDNIKKQRELIKALEKKLNAEQAEYNKLQKGVSSADESLRGIMRQISSRNQLINATQKQASLLREEIARTDKTAKELTGALDTARTRYADMVREAYRNYRQNNYLTLIFSSRDFMDAARKITYLRDMAAVRERKIAEIDSLRTQVATQQQVLAQRKSSLDSVLMDLSSQKDKLRRDETTARTTLGKLSEQSKASLRRKAEQQKQLNVARDELARLTKGNTVGDSFSAKTTGLKLPVAGGVVKRFKGNMAEISGPAGAVVSSVYDGKVLVVQENRTSGNWDVMIAHGRNVTAYMNLDTASVTVGQKISRDQQIGTLGGTLEIPKKGQDFYKFEYVLIFHIHSGDPKVTISAESCFKK